MPATSIRNTIDAAIRAERTTPRLRRSLERQLPRLRQRLDLPLRNPVDALLAFITGYVESVPSCLNLVRAVSKQLGFYDYAAPFLHMAEDFFLQPPDGLPEEGLEALLDESFLAHRLLEEINDHHIRHLQRPLLPVDMTEANIIVYHLLGEPLASRLEQLVQYAASQHLHREHLWLRLKDLPGTACNPDLLRSDQLLQGCGDIRLRLAVSG